MSHLRRSKRFVLFGIGFVFLLVTLLSVSASGLLFAQKSDADWREKAISAKEFVESRAGLLFQSGDYREALQALDEMLDQHPQDELLKRYRGIALNRTGESKEAVSVFKDLLSENPTHIPTRYFLAQAYLNSGNKAKAVTEWEWVLSREEGTVYESWARSSLMRAGELGARPTRRRKSPEMKRWNVYGRYGYEYDSNVILRPEDDSLASSRDHNAGRQVFDLALSYRAYSKRDMAVDLYYSVSQTVHDDSLNEFNFHSEDFGVSVRKRVQMGNQDVILGARYDVVIGFLHENLFTVDNRGYLSADTRFSPNTRTVFYDRIMLSNYGPDGGDRDLTSRDGVYNDVGVAHYYYFSDYRSHVFARAEINTAGTEGDNFDKVGMTTRVGLHHPLLEKLDFDVSVGLKARFYPHFSSRSTRDARRRRDWKWDVYTGMTYHLTPNLGLLGFYRYTNAANQNNFYDYSRQIGGAQLVYNQSF